MSATAPAVPVIAAVLLIALTVFFVVMWVRLVVDWIRTLRPGFRPRGGVLVVAEAAYLVTDPPIRAVRRIVPSIRIGDARLDFSWSIVMLVCLVLIWVLGLLL
jgi:YggT family protein